MNDDTPSPSARAIERLTRAESALRDELVTHAVDYVLGLKLRDALDLAQLRALVLSALTDANVRRVISRHALPGFRRYAQAILTSDTQVGMLLSEATRPRIHAIARKLRPPRAKWFQGAVEPALVRRLLSPVWTQVLSSFASRLPIPGVGSFGGAGSGAKREPLNVAGFLTRSVAAQAEKIVDRGRSVMGGLGVEVEKRMAEAARGFSDSASQIFRDALRQRLESEEGRELLGQITTAVVDRVLSTTFADLQHDVEALPIDDVFEVTPQVVAHAAKTNYVQDIVQCELDAYLALEAGRTLRELLEELGVLAEVRALLLERGNALTTRFVQSKPFADWFSRLLAE